MKLMISTSARKPRQQSGVVPYRKKRDGSVEILMVRTTHAGNWGLPKGGVEAGMTPLASAMKEAEEEAGAVGVAKDFVDITEYVKGSTGRAQVVEWYVMRVKGLLTEYLEAGRRERRWFKIDKAIKKADKKVASVIEAAAPIIDLYNK